jgi:hypothetical protein
MKRTEKWSSAWGMPFGCVSPELGVWTCLSKALQEVVTPSTRANPVNRVMVRVSSCHFPRGFRSPSQDDWGSEGDRGVRPVETNRESATVDGPPSWRLVTFEVRMSLSPADASVSVVEWQNWTGTQQDGLFSPLVKAARATMRCLS